jgi:Ras-related protein Rab-28
MLDKYVYGANAVILVYDVTNSRSFENLEDWLVSCRAVMNANVHPPTSAGAAAMSRPAPVFALVANKIDMEHLRTVKSDRHHKFAQDYSLLTYAVSAKSGEGISLCFQKIAAELLGIR